MSTLARMFAFVSAVGVLSAAGCNIVTPVAYAIEGPGQIDAEYTLPKKKTVGALLAGPTAVLPEVMEAMVARVVGSFPPDPYASLPGCPRTRGRVDQGGRVS